MNDVNWLHYLRDFMSGFPGTEEYLYYRTPAFRIKKKMIVRLREDGETLVLFSPDRDVWLTAEPEMFYVTDHYFNYPLILVCLDKVDGNVLNRAITEAWLYLAPQKLKDQFLSYHND